MAYVTRWMLNTDVSTDRQLHDAIEDGDLQRVVQLVEEGASVNCYTDGLTPVARAISSGHPDVAHALLKYRPDVHQGRRLFSHEHQQVESTSLWTREMDMRHQPLLILAVIKGYCDLVHALIKLGADVNATDENNRCTLHMAVLEGHLSIVDLLLQHGCNVNRVDINSNASLHLAASRGYYHIAETLIAADATVNLPGQHDFLPLHLACQRGDQQMVEMLLKAGSMVNAKDDLFATPLHYAAEGGYLEIAVMLLRQRAHSSDLDGLRETPVHKACSHGHVEIVELFARQCWVDLNQEAGLASVRRTPLQMAVASGHLDVVKTLLDLGANIDCTDSVHQESALNWAIRHQNEEIVDLLMGRGINIDNKNSPDGSTPLHVACIYDQNGSCAGIVRKLLDQNAELNVADARRRETALHIAARRGCTAIVRALLSGASIDVNMKDHASFTPLRTAIHFKQTESALLLIEKGADMELHPKGMSCSLHSAINHGLYRVAVALVQHGANVNKVDDYGETALAHLCNSMEHRLQGEHCDAAFILYMVLVAAGGVLTRKPQVRPALPLAGMNFVKVLNHGNSSPASLYMLSQWCVRDLLRSQTFGSTILPKVAELPLPKPVKEGLCLKLPL